MSQTLILDLDDFSLSSPNFEYLLKLKEHFPNFKVTLFTVPVDQTILAGQVDLGKYQEWSKMLNEYKDWIEIAVHGFTHAQNEMMVEYDQAIKILKASENMFKEIRFKEKRFFFGKKWKKYKINVPYKKIFKAPRWQMSPDAYRACRDKGYIVGIDRNQATPNIKDMTYYKYNWSIEEPFPKDYRIVKGHGHISGMANDLSLCYENLLNMPTNAKFLFISEYYDESNR